MSAVAAFSSTGTSGAFDAGRRVRAMLAAMRELSGDSAEVSTATGGDAAPRVALGAGAHAWEHALHGRTTQLAAHGPHLIAADASLVHRHDLIRALGPAAAAASDAALILAAYEAWDVGGFARLEGDFAFVLWDGARGRLVAARAFAGHRTLFHAHVGATLFIASSVGGLLADGAVPRDIDLGAVATIAAGLWGHSPQTAYRAIEELPAGHALVWDRSGVPRITQFWHAPETILHRRQPLDAAADELRALLVDAVRERLAPEGPTGISLSGGWDSTAVGGAATIALAGDTRRRLQPVSISYPEGDPGREDELIGAVVGQWGIETSWLDVDSIPMFETGAAGAARRDLPFAHTFESWNRALSRRARELGVRVMLDGVGGDQLFQVSDIFLSDLFGQGRWVELARQWRGRGGRGLQDFWRWAVHPALPGPLARAIARARGKPPLRHHFHRDPPMWLNAHFLSTHGVLEREAAATPALPRSSRVLGETHAYLRFPFFARIVSTLRSFAVEEGVELRSPLLDDRIVRFAARRPWSERADRNETKLVLRRAMRGLLPEHVLAPRARRTGVTSAYFLRQMRGAGRPLVETMLKDSLLASIGMIDAPRLRQAWAHVLQHDNDEVAGRIFFTLQAELWLRAHADPLPPTAG